MIDQKIKDFEPKCEKSKEMAKLLQMLLNIKIVAVEVDHCPQSYGCLIYSMDENVFGPGNKIVYSGDTRPC